MKKAKKVILSFLAVLMLSTHVLPTVANNKIPYEEYYIGNLVYHIEYNYEIATIRTDGFTFLHVNVTEHFFNGTIETHTGQFRLVDFDGKIVETLDVGPYQFSFDVQNQQINNVGFDGNLDIIGYIFEKDDGYLTEEEFDLLTRYMEQFISFESGQIKVDTAIYNSRLRTHGNFITDMTEGINYLNKLARDGEIIINDDGTIYEIYNYSFIPFARLNRTTLHWWGRSFYRCQVTTRNIVTRLRAHSAGTAARIVWNAVKGNWVGFAAGSFFTARRLLLACRLAAHNNPRGTIANMHWATTFTVRS